MKIGILSKRTTMFTGKMKDYLENKGNKVKIYTAENLCINESLFENDFYVMKSKQLIFLYAGYYLVANDIPVIPNPEISHKHKDRLEAHFLIKNANLLYPQIYLGTLEALKNNLKPTDFPLITKPLMGSGSIGVKVVNSFEDLNSIANEIIYLEKFIKGTHYIVYFIDNEICTLEKLPLKNEHSKMKKMDTSNDIEDVIMKWKTKYDLLFGHLDIVREEKTKKLFVVDPGSFPEFSNWQCSGNPVSKICNLILGEYRKLKNEHLKVGEIEGISK